ncbi:putative inhibitor of apoptosis isoform X3 [Convolutriloba macropyga]|uniref:putative inhibitor of apoptosis isoform X3 n=1 Tax=Convolutriloba macropyga TaxID=536237 RepID=UPI003F526A9A
MEFDVLNEKLETKKEIALNKRLMQCYSIVSIASFALIRVQERLKLGYNFVALSLLQYKYDQKSGRMICSECNYAFSLSSSYNYEQHSSYGKDCNMAIKGGYTLNPRDNHGSNAIEQVFSNAMGNDRLFDERQMEGFSDEKMLEGETVMQEGDNLSLVLPKSSSTFEELAVQNFVSNEDIEYYSFRERLNTFDEFGEMKMSVKRILSYLGFFSPKPGEKCLKCIFCKLKAPFDTIRSLFRKHRTFSPNCCFAYDDPFSFYATEHEDTVTSDEIFVAKMLRDNLSTFTAKCDLSDAQCIEAALVGFQYLPRSHMIKCFGCDFCFRAEYFKKYSNFLDIRIAAKCKCDLKWPSLEKNLQTLSDSVYRENSWFRRYFDDLVPETVKLREAHDSRFERGFSGHNLWTKDSRTKVVVESKELSSTAKAKLDSLESGINAAIAKRDQEESNECVSSWEPGISPKELDVSGVERAERVATTKLRTREEVSRCSVCLCNEANRLFVGCGHICTCQDCVLQVPSCPICRARITGVVPIELPARD